MHSRCVNCFSSEPRHANVIPKGFVYRLKAHLLHHLPGKERFLHGREPTSHEVSSVRIQGDTLFAHKVMRINFTTYDMRRDQDSINPDNHADVMMLAPANSEHPFLYARVIGIFHVKAYTATLETTSISPQLVHVVWLRWFDLDTTAPGGFQTRRLHRLKWADVNDGAFGFVSPNDILRGCHLIPRALPHGSGRSDTALPGVSTVRRERDGGVLDDWDHHYVGMYVNS